MTRNWLFSLIVALSSLLTPLVTSAEDTNSNSTIPATPAAAAASATMTKDAWLSEMEPQLPAVVCKGFMEDSDLKKRFDELSLSYSKCVTIIPGIASKCQKELYDKIPSTIDEKVANTWGTNLGECIGKNFAEAYLIPK